MILRSVTVESWRCLRQRVELAGLDPGLNVVFGPNEAGKSSLMDAICRGFFDRHGTAGDQMRARQPWESTLAPRVELEFEAGGRVHRLKKQFVSEASSELYRLQDGQWELLDRGRSADDRLLSLARGEAPGRGLSKPQHWGLGQVLWAAQGQAVHIDVGDSQKDRLYEALKLSLDTSQGEAIEAEIEDRYLSIYTPGGRLRGGQQRPQVKLLQEQQEQADQQVEELEQRMLLLEQLAHDLAAAEAGREQTQRKLQSLGAELQERRAQLAQLQQQERQYLKLQNAATRADSQWMQLNERVKQIKDADLALEKGRQKVQQLEDSHLQRERQVREAQKQVQRDSKRRDRAREQLQRLTLLRDQAGRRVDWLELARSREQARKRLEQTLGLQRSVEQCSQQLEQLGAPSKRALTSLRKLDREITGKQAELAAAGLELRLEPARPLAVQPEVDGEARPGQQLEQPLELTAVDRIKLTIDGVGTLQVRSGASEARELAAALAELQRKWREKVSAYARTELSGLDELFSESQVLKQRLADLQKRQQEDEPAESVRSELERLEQRARELLAQDPGLERLELDQQPDQQRQQQQAALELQQAGEDLEQAEQELELSREALAGAEKDEASESSALGAARGNLRQREAEARDARDDGHSDDQRREALSDALQQKDAADQRLAAAPQPALEDQQQELLQLEQQEQASRARRRQQDDAIARQQQRLVSEGGEGLYSRLVEAREQADVLQQAHRREALDAEAVKLLRETLQRQKREVFEALVRPVRQLVSGSLRRLVGPRYEGLEFDERLMPATLRPAGREAEVQAEDLSHGTREQLMLLVRLALARLLGREGERQCLILDDPLVNTDPGRQLTALRLLQEAAQEAQILVFTCHPLAYEGVEGARMYDLPALRGEARP